MNLDQITIVVPTRNEEANVQRFLASIPVGMQTIVIDSSDDATPDLIARFRPTTTIIRANVNIPEARQLGADAAATDWLLYADADVVFAGDYFDHLRELRDRPGDGGMTGTKGTVDGFDTYHRWFRAGQRLFARVGVPAATGSNMLVRAATLQAVGGFDPNLSVNEDTELMFRIQRSGWMVRFCPQLAVLSFDHRRLELGLARKIAHGAVRNTALYFGVFDRRVRSGDWGYWDEADRSREAGARGW